MTITSRETVLAKFTEISCIPRCSKQEQQISCYLRDWAAGLGFATRTDRVGNILITVPATPDREQAPTVVLQSHLDMVCEKTAASHHDFSRDPLRLYIDRDWLRAEGTTLGADNGIGIALALALAEDRELSHPKLELLFTVDEETGLTGALHLEPGFFSGRLLLNLDSEDEGVLTIGCAGGRDSELLLDLDYDEWPQGDQLYALTVAGLRGGHSGVDIHAGLANANVLLARTLAELRRHGNIHLAGLDGGSAHNVIPREATARLAIPATAAPDLISRVGELALTLRRSYPNEPDLTIDLVRQEGVGAGVFSPSLAGIVVDLLLVGPDGVMAMSKEAPGVVETSINLATIMEKAGQLSILFSQRSDNPAGLAWMTAKLEGLARLTGAGIITSGGYPGWPPDHDSALLAGARKVYRQMFGQEPTIEIIHAGLECGIIGAKNPGMDMLSLGPTIKNPHSPEEKLYLPSLDRFCPFIRELLTTLR